MTNDSKRTVEFLRDDEMKELVDYLNSFVESKDRDQVEKEFRKEATKNIAKKLSLDAKQLNALATAFYKDNFDETISQVNSLENALEKVKSYQASHV